MAEQHSGPSIIHTEGMISYRLVDPTINFSTKRATCKVKIPSDPLPRYANAVGYPEAVLFVKDPDSDIHCIEIMRESSHRNILHALVVAKKEVDKKDYYLVWTDFYTDSVLNYLESTALGTSCINAMHGNTAMLPTVNLRSLVSQAFDGLEYLWLLGKYHGNLTLKNTYYHNLAGELVTKLTDFKLKDRATLKHCQAEDCQAIGHALECVSKAAKARKAKRQNFDCYIIDDLAKRLKEFSWGDLPYMKQEVYGHPFFWNSDDIKVFFVSRVPVALNSPKFRDKVNACEELCTLPWGSDGFGGFVKVMDGYRSRRNIPVYDKHDRVGYVQFLSGLYAHEKQLKGGPVEAAIMEKSPRAFMILYNLIPRPPRTMSGR